MDHATLRKIIRGMLDESSRQRRAATRDTLTQAYHDDPENAPPVRGSGRTHVLAQIAQLGYSLAKETVGGPPKYGFTMTSIQKVGINPASTFETPLALYAYPVDPKHVDELLGGQMRSVGRQIPEIASAIPAGDTPASLPFVASAPYINFFRINDTPGVYYTSVGMNETAYRDAIDGLHMWYTDRSGSPDADSNFRKALVRAQQHNKVNRGSSIMPASALSDYGRLATIWTLSRSLSLLKTAADVDNVRAGQADESSIKQSNISLWRTLLLSAGVKAVIDDAGKSLIHRLEPFQLAVMDTTILEMIQQFDNVTRARRGTFAPPPGEVQKQRAAEAAKTISDIRKNLSAEDPPFEDIFWSIVYLTSYPTEAVRQLREAGIFDELLEFVRDFIKNGEQRFVEGGINYYAAAYKLFGEVVLDDLIDRVMSSAAPYAFISSLISARTASSIPFALKILKAFTAKNAAEIPDKVQDYANLIIDLAHVYAVEEVSNANSFIQEVIPIIRLFPDGKDTLVTPPRSTQQVPILGYIREVIDGSARDLEAERQKRREEQFKEKGYKRPHTGDLTDTENKADEVLKLFKHRVAMARRNHHYVKSQFKSDVENDLPALLRASSHDFIPTTRFLDLSMMLPETDDNYKIEEIYDRYKAAIQEACRPITQEQSNVIWGGTGTDEEKNERARKMLQDHAAEQIKKIKDAIDTLEREMTDFLTTLKTPESEGPLHERLMRRWKLQ